MVILLAFIYLLHSAIFRRFLTAFVMTTFSNDWEEKEGSHYIMLWSQRCVENVYVISFAYL
jgi:hypothetical protein